MNGGGGAFLERILKTSDEILYGKREAPLEAEIVQPEDHSPEPG
jgi:hypothetical protein